MDCPNHIRRTKCSIKKRIIVRRSVRSMFGGTNIRPVKNGLNEQFCVGAQTVVSLLQTSQIISDVCFITDHVAYASSDKTSHLNRDGTLLLFFFLPGVDASHVYTCVLWR